jgi:hypothetical protein
MGKIANGELGNEEYQYEDANDLMRIGITFCLLDSSVPGFMEEEKRHCTNPNVHRRKYEAEYQSGEEEYGHDAIENVVNDHFLDAGTSHSTKGQYDDEGQCHENSMGSALVIMRRDIDVASRAAAHCCPKRRILIG